ELVVHHATEPVMGEVEALTSRVHNPAAHELLQALCGLGGSEPARLLEQREAEVSADDRCHRGQAAARLGQALQAGADAGRAGGAAWGPGAGGRTRARAAPPAAVPSSNSRPVSTIPNGLPSLARQIPSPRRSTAASAEPRRRSARTSSTVWTWESGDKLRR